MKKIINDPKNYVDEAMEGILAAYGDKVTFFEGDKRVLVRKGEKRNGQKDLPAGIPGPSYRRKSGIRGAL